MHAKSLQLCLTFCKPMDCSPPGSFIFSRQEYWSGLPCPPPGNVPNPGIELTPSLRSPPSAGTFFTARTTYLYIVKYSSCRRDRVHAQFFALDYQFLLGFLDIDIGLPCFPDCSVDKESACNAETSVRFLSWEDPLEKG